MTKCETCQTIFYWNLAARNVARAFELKPNLQPPQAASTQAGHSIELSKAQARSHIKYRRIVFND
jgi:hypothetical protein